MLLNLSKFNRCDWFILAWVLYYLQGVLYPMGGVIATGLLGINLLVSMVCAIKIWHIPHQPSYFKGLNLLVLMFSIYGFALIISSPSTLYYPISGISIPSYNYIKSIYLSILPIYAFYYFSYKGYLTAEKLRLWAIIFCVSCIVSYYYNMRQGLEFLIRRGSLAKEITNNVGYTFLSLIPIWVLFRKKPLLQYLGLTLCMAYIIMGMKRGAILIGGVIVLYFVWRIIKTSRGRQRVVIFFLTIVLAIVAVYFVIDMLSNSDYFVQRLEATKEGNSSGRDSLYSFFWTYFTERTDFVQYLFGRGANGTLEIYYNYAHNDWLEIAVNQGMFGVIIYVVYWICFYRTWRRSTNVEAKMILALVGVIYFAKTIFSMSYSDMTYICTSVFGYALATTNKII